MSLPWLPSLLQSQLLQHATEISAACCMLHAPGRSPTFLATLLLPLFVAGPCCRFQCYSYCHCHCYCFACGAIATASGSHLLPFLWHFSLSVVCFLPALFAYVAAHAVIPPSRYPAIPAPCVP